MLVSQNRGRDSRPIDRSVRWVRKMRNDETAARRPDFTVVQCPVPALLWIRTCIAMFGLLNRTALCARRHTLPSVNVELGEYRSYRSRSIDSDIHSRRSILIDCTAIRGNNTSPQPLKNTDKFGRICWRPARAALYPFALKRSPYPRILHRNRHPAYLHTV